MAEENSPVAQPTYADLYHVWEKVKDHPEVKSKFPTMGSLYQAASQEPGGEMFAVGTKPSTIKNVSIKIDDALNKTGIPQKSGDLFAGLFEKLGVDRQVGQQFGEEFPRATAEGLAAMTGAAAVIGGGPVTWGMAGMGALGLAGAAGSAAKTYEQTDNPLAGLISGGSALAMPSAMKWTKGAITTPLALKVMPKEVPGLAGKVAERGFDLIGDLTGMTGVSEGARQLSSLAQGQGLAPTFTKEHAVEVGVGNAVFAPLMALGLFRPGNVGIARSEVSMKRLEIEGAIKQANELSAQAQKAADAQMATERAAQEKEGLFADAWKPGGEEPVVPTIGSFGESSGRVVGDFTPKKMQGEWMKESGPSEDTWFGRAIEIGKTPWRDKNLPPLFEGSEKTTPIEEVPVAEDFSPARDLRESFGGDAPTGKPNFNTSNEVNMQGPGFGGQQPGGFDTGLPPSFDVLESLKDKTSTSSAQMEAKGNAAINAAREAEVPNQVNDKTVAAVVGEHPATDGPGQARAVAGAIDGAALNNADLVAAKLRTPAAQEQKSLLDVLSQRMGKLQEQKPAERKIAILRKSEDFELNGGDYEITGDGLHDVNTDPKILIKVANEMGFDVQMENLSKKRKGENAGADFVDETLKKLDPNTFEISRFPLENDQETFRVTTKEGQIVPLGKNADFSTDTVGELQALLKQRYGLENVPVVERKGSWRLTTEEATKFLEEKDAERQKAEAEGKPVPEMSNEEKAVRQKFGPELERKEILAANEAWQTLSPDVQKGIEMALKKKLGSGDPSVTGVAGLLADDFNTKFYAKAVKILTGKVLTKEEQSFKETSGFDLEIRQSKKTGELETKDEYNMRIQQGALKLANGFENMYKNRSNQQSTEEVRLDALFGDGTSVGDLIQKEQYKDTIGQLIHEKDMNETYLAVEEHAADLAKPITREEVLDLIEQGFGLTEEQMKGKRNPLSEEQILRMNIIMQQMLMGNIKQEMKGKNLVLKFNNKEYIRTQFAGLGTTQRGFATWKTVGDEIKAIMTGINPATMTNVFGTLIQMRLGKIAMVKDTAAAVRKGMQISNQVDPVKGVKAPSIPDSVFKSLTLNDSNHLAAYAKGFYDRYFRFKGYDKLEAEGMSNIALRVAAAFKDIQDTNLFGIKDKTDAARAWGMSETLQNKRVGKIGVNEAQILGADKPFDGFAKLFILAHESVHRLFDEHAFGRLSPDRAAKVNRVNILARELRPEDRGMFLQEVLGTMIPDKYWKHGTETKKFLDDLVMNASKDPDEFIATFGGLGILGSSSFGKKGEFIANNRMMESVLYLPDKLRDFVLGNYMDVFNTMSALKSYLVNKEGAGRGSFTPKQIQDFVAGALDPEHPDYFQFDPETNVSAPRPKPRIPEPKRSYKFQMEQIETYDQIAKVFKELASTQEEVNRVQNELLGLNGNVEGGITGTVPKVTGTVGDVVGRIAVNNPDTEGNGKIVRLMAKDSAEALEGKPFGVEWNWYRRNFWPKAQLAAELPFIQPAVDLAVTHQGMAKNFIKELFAPFMTVGKKGKLVFDEKGGSLHKLLTNEKLNDGLRSVCLIENKEGKMLTQAERVAIWKEKGLTPEDMTILENHRASIATSMFKAQNLIFESMSRQTIEPLVSLKILDTVGGDATRAHELGKLFTEGYLATKGGEMPVRQDGARFTLKGLDDTNTGMAKLVQFEQIVGKDVARDVLETVEPIWKKAVNHGQFLIERPWDTPETRPGPYYLNYKNAKGEQQFHGFRTRAEFMKKWEAVKNEEGVKDIVATDGTQQAQDRTLLQKKMVQSFTEVETEAFKRAKEKFVEENPECADVFEKFNFRFGPATMFEITARSMAKHTLKRKFEGGREELNFALNAMDYFQGLSRNLARKYTSDMAALYLTDKKMRENPAVRNQMRDYLDMVINPPAHEWNKIKSMVFHWTLGGNLSSLLVETAQPIFTLVPELVRSGVDKPLGVAEAYKKTFKAMQEVRDIAAARPKDKELAAQLQRAIDTGNVDAGILTDIANSEDLGLANLTNLAEGRPVLDSTLKLLAKPIYHYSSWVRNLYTSASSRNSHIAFVAGYLRGRELGKSVDGCYDMGLQMAQRTMHTGGRAARPGIFQGLGPKAYGAMGAFYTLQHYTVASMAMMARLGSDAFNKNKGLSVAERAAAKKAFLTMGATQFFAAGALGMPMVGLTTSILEQVFGMDIQGNVRKAIAELSDDPEIGSAMADTVMHGGMSRTLGMGMVDFSGRFSLGQVFGLDPEYAMQPAAMLGAGGSVAFNMAKGMSEMYKKTRDGDSEGAMRAGVGILPTSWKNLVNGLTQGNDVRNAKGELVYQASDLETVAKSIGLRPKELAMKQEETRLLKHAQDLEDRKVRGFHEGLAEMLLKGDAGGVRAALLERQREDPLYDPHSGLESVVQIAQNKVIPVDPRTMGSRASAVAREEVSRTFGNRPQMSEVERLQRRVGMQQQVQLPGHSPRVTPRKMKQAEMVDQLVAQGYSRVHAQAAVQRLLARIP